MQNNRQTNPAIIIIFDQIGLQQPQVVNLHIFSGIFRFYRDGFRNLSSLGRNLWVIIIIKLFVFFVVLRLLFFPDFLGKNFRTDQERSDHVIEELTK